MRFGRAVGGDQRLKQLDGELAQVGTETVGLEQGVRSRRVRGIREVCEMRERAQGPWVGVVRDRPFQNFARSGAIVVGQQEQAEVIPRVPVVGRGLQELSPVRTEDRSRGRVADRQPAVLQQIEPGLLVLAAHSERT